MDKQYVVAVEAGNFTTVAVVADQYGRALAFGRSAYHDIALLEPSSADIATAVERAVAAAGIPTALILSTCCSVPGFMWPADTKRLTSELKKLTEGSDVEIISRATAAVLATTGLGTGIGIAYDSRANTSAHQIVMDTRQGWTANAQQIPTGERALAERALDAVFKAELGLAPETALTAAALHVFWKQNLVELLHATKTMEEHLFRHKLECAKGFAQAVVEASAAGDAVAQRIVQEEAEALVAMAKVAARRVGLVVHFPVVLMGNLPDHANGELRKAFNAELARKLPNAKLAEPELPILGGTLLGAVGMPSRMYHFNSTKPYLPKAEILVAQESGSLYRF